AYPREDRGRPEQPAPAGDSLGCGLPLRGGAAMSTPASAPVSDQDQRDQRNPRNQRTQARPFPRARGSIGRIGLRRPLPLRLWLIVVMVAIIGSGFLTQLMMTSLIGVWRQQAADAQLTDIRQELGTDPASWENPAWQRSAAASLADMQVDAAVFTRQSAQPVF